MRPSSYFVLYAKLQTLSEDHQQSLLRCLSDEHIEGIRKHHIKNMPLALEDFSLPHLVDKVHYSWLLPFLNKQEYPALFFPLFSEKTREKLAKSLSIPWEPSQDGSSPLLDYLRLVVEEAFFWGQTILPVSYLQNSPLKDLLFYNKQELVDLIYELSLWDMAIELRQIVDQKVLQEIASTLSDEEKKEIARISKQALVPLFPRAHYKDLPSFEQEMHKRGIARLGIALLEESSDFLWHITRVLDKGRGTILLNMYEKKALANHAPDMINLVLDVLEDRSS